MGDATSDFFSGSFLAQNLIDGLYQRLPTGASRHTGELFGESKSVAGLHSQRLYGKSTTI